MEKLNIINLPDVQIFSPWTSAPLGALLQMKVVGREFGLIEVRANFDLGGQKLDAILIVSGAYAGRLVTQTHLNGAAIDLRGHLDIAAEDPTPFSRAETPLIPGMVFQLSDHPKTYFMWFNLIKECGTGDGFICLQSNDPLSILRGIFIADLQHRA